MDMQLATTILEAAAADAMLDIQDQERLVRTSTSALRE